MSEPLYIFGPSGYLAGYSNPPDYVSVSDHLRNRPPEYGLSAILGRQLANEWDVVYVCIRHCSVSVKVIVVLLLLLPCNIFANGNTNLDFFLDNSMRQMFNKRHEDLP